MQSTSSSGEDINVLIIAHRVSTFYGCGQSFELEKGGFFREGTYRELIHALLLAKTTIPSIAG